MSAEGLAAELCSICQQGFGEESIKFLMCGHKVHDQCWAQYLAARGRPGSKMPCPECKLSEEDLEERARALTNAYVLVVGGCPLSPNMFTLTS